MATVLTKPQTNALKVEAKLSQELAQATSRIRWTDLLTGGLTLVALVLGYTLLAVLADKLFDLPSWARFGGLTVFLVTFAVAAWFSVVRPLRARINPRFAARQVEQTLADGKNAIINWVDLKNQDLPESVRAAVGAKAAEGVADADVARVGESRRVLVLLSSVGVLVAGLAVFFLLVKSAPFFSLLNRAYNPFTSSGIATRTAITLDEPVGGDVTVTSGDSLTVRVTLAGSLPDAKSPDRPRLLVRYNPDAEEFDELVLDPAGSKREFAAKLPPSVIQNGLRYAVAAGDARTAEFAVTVRTRPLLRDFTVKYEYPAYTRLQPETTTDPRVEGYRGTQVTLVARANRGVKDARLVFDTQLTQVLGTVAVETPDAVSFRFPLEEACNYRIAWTAADGETAESAAYPVRVLVDQAPVVTITAPKDEETTLPADGLLKVDGVAADDFGLAGLTLRLRIAETPPVVLEPKKYRDGKSFRRASDQSDPTVFEYKDSVKLSTLKTKTGDAVKLAPGTVLEYWLEATDNCTTPTANVGKSKVQRVKIAPLTPPAEQKKQEQNQAERGEQEKKHQADQDQQQNKEQRQPPQPRPDNVEKKPQEGNPPEGQENPQNGQPQPNDGQPKPKDGDPKDGQPKPKDGPSKNGDDQQPNPDKSPMTKPPEPGQSNDAGTPKEQGKTGEQPPPDKSAKPKEAGGKSGDQNLQDQADKVQQALNDKQNAPSEARPPESNPDTADKPPTDPDAGKPGKAKPQSGDAQNPPEKSGEPKPQPGNDGPSKPDATPAESKPQGGGEKANPEASQPKPDAGSKSADSGESQPKPETKPGQSGEPKPGQEKATPQDANAKPKAGDQNNGAKPDPMKAPQAGEGKPDAGTPKPGDPKTGKPQPDATKGEAKPQPGEKSGQPEERPGDEAKPGEAGDPQPGAAKPEKPTQPGKAKPTPSDAAGQDPKAGEQKPPMGEGAGEAKPEGKPQPTPDPMGKPTGAGEQPKGGEKSNEKPAPGSKGAGEKKPDAQELEQAIKDLKSGNPEKEKADREKLDETMGKENREATQKKAEQLERDLTGNDKAKQDAARKEIEELAKQAEKNGSGEKKDGAAGDKKNPSAPNDKQPTAEQIEEAKKLAEDLTSKDDAKRDAAEKKVDAAVGKEQREQIQQDMKDAQSGDPKTAEVAKKRIDERAKPKPEDKTKSDQRGPGARPDTPGDKLDDDPKNRRKTADLQLKQFEKAKTDADLQKKLGYTPEQYDEFLKGYAEMVKRQNDAADKPEVLPTPNEAGGPTTIKVGEGAGTKPVAKRSDGSTGTAGSGVGTAPPGFTDAQRKFAEEAAKLRKPDPKK